MTKPRVVFSNYANAPKNGITCGRFEVFKVIVIVIIIIIIIIIMPVFYDMTPCWLMYI